jgi:hypothetical protein
MDVINYFVGKRNWQCIVQHENCTQALVQKLEKVSKLPELGRIFNFRISCSKDYGATWPKMTDIDGDSSGGYSDLAAIDDDTLLMVWEHNDTGNIYSTQTTVANWC